MVDFSQRLKKVRMDRHLTQAQVARKIGVTASMVSSYETDIRLPSYDVMIRIADLFGVSVDYLLGKTERREGGDLGVVSDEDIKFALFQGSGPVTDEMYAEVKRFAQFIQARQKEEE